MPFVSLLLLSPLAADPRGRLETVPLHSTAGSHVQKSEESKREREGHASELVPATTVLLDALGVAMLSQKICRRLPALCGEALQSLVGELHNARSKGLSKGLTDPEQSVVSLLMQGQHGLPLSVVDHAAKLQHSCPLSPRPV